MASKMIIGRRHGSTASEIVVGPEAGPGVVRDRFAGFLTSKADPVFGVVEVWDSMTGLDRTHHLERPVTKPESPKK